MKTPPATPYLLPPEDVVAEHAWTMDDGRALPERLDHWDPFTDTELFRTVEIDADVAREACHLGADATFAVTASWYSSRTRLAASSADVELGMMGGRVRASVSLKVPGAVAGGRLDLRTRLILRHPGAAPSPISPRREGAILWTDETRVSLEGGASRFPVTAVDFAALTRLPDEASWVLEWKSDELEAPVLSALRLLVNAADGRLLDALRSGTSDVRSTVIRSFVLFDVAKTLVDGALKSEQFVSDPESFEDGSVGRMLFELLAMCWPGTPVKALLVRSHEDPARLAAELQAHLGVLG